MTTCQDNCAVRGAPQLLRPSHFRTAVKSLPRLHVPPAGRLAHWMPLGLCPFGRTGNCLNDLGSGNRMKCFGSLKPPSLSPLLGGVPDGAESARMTVRRPLPGERRPLLHRYVSSAAFAARLPREGLHPSTLVRVHSPKAGARTAG